MNERIKELRKQAIDFCLDKGSQGNLSEEVAAKFAELLIQECLDCLSMELGNQYTPEEMLFQAKYRKIIREHFGVKG